MQYCRKHQNDEVNYWLSLTKSGKQIRLETIVRKSEDYIRFPNTRVSNKYKFE